MSERLRRLGLKLSTVSTIYFVLLGVLLILLHWWAEHLLPVWVLLFVPPVLLLLPLAPLMLYAAWRRRWAWLIAHFVCGGIVLLVFSRYRMGGAGGAEGALTVVTHNIGQGNKFAFDQAFAGASPDVILLQDANYGEKEYARRYPDLQIRRIAQFLLLSRHEIVSAAPVNDALWRGRPVAARFVIRANGREIALYNVHFPTPRRSLRHAFTPRVALEMLWISDAPTDDHPSYRTWLRARVALAEQLTASIARETLPYVVAGDLNTPDHGVVYRQFAARMQDAHAVAGSGWGATFPADSRRDGMLARVFGPWLRLDYIFAGPGFKPVECRVALDHRSQHRAVLARLAPVP